MAVFESPENLLAELAEVRAAIALTESDLADKRRALLAAVQPALDDLDAEYAPMLDAARGRMTDLESAVRAAVVERGATVRGEGLQVVYSGPRVTWDTAGLERYAVDHPEVLYFRKVGAPSAAIRKEK